MDYLLSNRPNKRRMQPWMAQGAGASLNGFNPSANGVGSHTQARNVWTMSGNASTMLADPMNEVRQRADAAMDGNALSSREPVTKSQSRLLQARGRVPVSNSIAAYIDRGEEPQAPRPTPLIVDNRGRPGFEGFQGPPAEQLTIGGPPNAAGIPKYTTGNPLPSGGEIRRSEVNPGGIALVGPGADDSTPTERYQNYRATQGKLDQERNQIARDGYLLANQHAYGLPKDLPVFQEARQRTENRLKALGQVDPVAERQLKQMQTASALGMLKTLDDLEMKLRGEYAAGENSMFSPHLDNRLEQIDMQRRSIMERLRGFGLPQKDRNGVNLKKPTKSQDPYINDPENMNIPSSM